MGNLLAGLTSNQRFVVALGVIAVMGIAVFKYNPFLDGTSDVIPETTDQD